MDPGRRRADVPRRRAARPRRAAAAQRRRVLPPPGRRSRTPGPGRRSSRRALDDAGLAGRRPRRGRDGRDLAPRRRARHGPGLAASDTGEASGRRVRSGLVPVACGRGPDPRSLGRLKRSVRPPAPRRRPPPRDSLGAAAYRLESLRYGPERSARIVTSSPMTPATMKISAMPRSGPVPNHDPMRSASAPSVIDGITQNCAIGPMRNAVTGEAAVSRLWREPEDAALLLEGHDLLDDRLLRRLGDRGEEQVDEEPDRERQDLGADREDDRHDPHHDVREQQRPHRVGARGRVARRRSRRR